MHLASYKIGDSFTFANFTIDHGALYGTKARNYSTAYNEHRALIQTRHCGVCFFSKLRFSIFPLEQVEPSKLSNNMNLLILIFDWDEKALIIVQV